MRDKMQQKITEHDTKIHENDVENPSRIIKIRTKLCPEVFQSDLGSICSMGSVFCTRGDTFLEPFGGTWVILAARGSQNQAFWHHVAQKQRKIMSRRWS